MNFLNWIMASFLIAEARRLSSVHQRGQAFDKIVAAYLRLGEQPPSARLPLEVNLSLAAMASNVSRYSLVVEALALVESQLTTDRSLSKHDRRYVGAYIKALRILCEGSSWAEALLDREVAAGAHPAGVKRHLRANFPFL